MPGMCAGKCGAPARARERETEREKMRGRGKTNKNESRKKKNALHKLYTFYDFKGNATSDCTAKILIPFTDIKRTHS